MFKGKSVEKAAYNLETACLRRMSTSKPPPKHCILFIDGFNAGHVELEDVDDDNTILCKFTQMLKENIDRIQKFQKPSIIVRGREFVCVLPAERFVPEYMSEDGSRIVVNHSTMQWELWMKAPPPEWESRFAPYKLIAYQTRASIASWSAVPDQDPWVRLPSLKPESPLIYPHNCFFIFFPIHILSICPRSDLSY